MVIEKHGFNHFTIYETIGDDFLKQTYLYYNKRDAIKRFKAYVREYNKNRFKRYLQNIYA